MIPLTTMTPSSEEDTPIHYARRRLIQNRASNSSKKNFSETAVFYDYSHPCHTITVQQRRRRRLVKQSVMNYAGSNLPTYGGPAQHQLIVRGTQQRGHGHYTTAANHDYFTPPPVVRRQVPNQQAQFQRAAMDENGGAEWMDLCFRLLTCDGLCSWSAAPAVGAKRPQPPRCIEHTYHSTHQSAPANNWTCSAACMHTVTRCCNSRRQTTQSGTDGGRHLACTVPDHVHHFQHHLLAHLPHVNSRMQRRRRAFKNKRDRKLQFSDRH